MTPDSIEREITIDAPVERVWSVITEAEHLSSWFADRGADIELHPGGRLRLSWEEYGTTLGRVEAVEPHHRFAYRWTAHHAEAGTEPAEGNSTLVEFTLEPEGEGTRLRVVETGFAVLATGPQQRRGNYDSNVRGWAEMTQRIADYAQKVAA